MEGRHAVAVTDGGPRRPWLRRRGRRADAMIFAHAPLFESIKGIKFGVEREEELFFDMLLAFHVKLTPINIPKITSTLSL